MAGHRIFAFGLEQSKAQALIDTFQEFSGKVRCRPVAVGMPGPMLSLLSEGLAARFPRGQLGSQPQDTRPWRGPIGCILPMGERSRRAGPPPARAMGATPPPAGRPCFPFEIYVAAFAVEGLGKSLASTTTQCATSPS